MRLSRKLRKRHYYMVPAAGAQVGYSRAESYRAAERGDIPTEKDGRLLLVPRKRWDRIRKQLLRGPLPPTPQRSASANQSTASADGTAA
jgi:hypothetical protein